MTANKIFGPFGLEIVIARLKESRAVNKPFQQAPHLATFLNYLCDISITIKDCIHRFRARRDMVAKLEYKANLQYNTVLWHAKLNYKEKNKTICLASSDYSECSISFSFHFAYRIKIL